MSLRLRFAAGAASRGQTPRRATRGPDAGFTLVEVLVALGLMTAVALGAAHILTLSAASTSAARRQTTATLVAAAKLEQLHALTWGHREAGGVLVAVSDTTTDLSVDPPTAGGNGLRPSPPGTLLAEVAGYADYLDADGRWVGTGTAPPAGALYVRRWAIASLPGDPDTIAVQVMAASLVSARLRQATGSGGPLPGEAWLGSIRTRKRP